MDMQKTMQNFVEAEKMYEQVKHDLQICLAENMPNPFMKVDYTVVRREVDPENYRGYRPRK